MVEFELGTKLLPVVVIHDVSAAIPLAKTLAGSGIAAIEITLRSACALEAIERISQQVPQLKLGAGTVLTSAQLLQAKRAGAAFAVSPGFSNEVEAIAKRLDFPWLPGVATPSEIMRAMTCGLRHMKFFPAEHLGGVTYLRSLLGPFPDVRFCPTGGITAVNFRTYMDLKNVFAIGGSWMVPNKLVEQKEFDHIAILAREAAALAAGELTRGTITKHSRIATDGGE